MHHYLKITLTEKSHFVSFCTPIPIPALLPGYFPARNTHPLSAPVAAAEDGLDVLAALVVLLALVLEDVCGAAGAAAACWSAFSSGGGGGG